MYLGHIEGQRPKTSSSGGSSDLLAWLVTNARGSARQIVRARLTKMMAFVLGIVYDVMCLMGRTRRA